MVVVGLAGLVSSPIVFVGEFSVSVVSKLVRCGYVFCVYYKDVIKKVMRINEDVVWIFFCEVLIWFIGIKMFVDVMCKYVKLDDVVGIKVNVLGSLYFLVNFVMVFFLVEVVHVVGVFKYNVIIYDQYGFWM